MDRQKAEKWIEELRSKKYVQGAAYLRQVDRDETERYCCLGVFCEMAVEAGIILAPYYMEPMNGRRIYEYHSRDGQRWSGTMGPDVSLWGGFSLPPGLDDADMRYPGDGSFTMSGVSTSGPWSQQVTLASLNDDGLTFDQIADIINHFSDEL